jgi:hypothetical protein
MHRAVGLVATAGGIPARRRRGECQTSPRRNNYVLSGSPPSSSRTTLHRRLRVYGAFTSFHYTSMNTLIYAYITAGHQERQFYSEHNAADVHQLRCRYRRTGNRLLYPQHHTNPTEMISRIHKALIALGIFPGDRAKRSRKKFRSGKGQHGSSPRCVLRAFASGLS